MRPTFSRSRRNKFYPAGSVQTSNCLPVPSRLCSVGARASRVARQGGLHEGKGPARHRSRRGLLLRGSHHGRTHQEKITLTRQERAHWRHILWEELSRLPNLQIVVALGGYALEALVGHDSLTKARDSVFAIDVGQHRVQALANNPAHIMWHGQGHAARDAVAV